MRTHLNLKYYSKGQVSTILVVLYFLLAFLSLYEKQTLLINTLIVAIGGWLLISNFLYIAKRHLKLLWIFFGFSVFSFICLYLFQGKLTYTPIRVFVHFALFIVIIRYNISLKAIKWVLYLYVLYILYLIFIQGIYINSIFPGTSKNIIGWFAVGICVLYYTLDFKIKETSKVARLDIIPAVITVLLSLISLSRSNILCSFLLLFGVLWYNYRKSTLVKKAVLISAFIIVALSVTYVFFDLLEIGLQRFAQRGLESSERSLFLDSYFDKINFKTFLFGVDSNQYPFTLINGNFHNSFLLGHSNFGILFLMFVLFVCFLLVKRSYQSFFLAILVLVLLLRSYTDTIMFIGYFDFILFVLLYRIQTFSPSYSKI